MIPVTLHLKNFLSYGPELQTIQFADYPLICLSGKNGHGKSALLDAITWALWGQARKIAGTAKADEGLLHIGQTFMMVTLEFICNQTQYRVRREYAHTHGKPYAALEFGIIDLETGHVRSLTDKTIRATQAVIENTIQLDFDTFVNSAFLRQGQSNEFSKKSAKERKKILATILDLDRYETVKIKAQERIKAAESFLKSLLLMKDSITHELQETQEAEAHLQQLRQQIDTSTQQEDTLQNEIVSLEQQLQACRIKKSAYDAIHTQCNALHEEARMLLQELPTAWHQWRQVHRTTLATAKAAFNHNAQQLMNTIHTQQQYLQEILSIKHELLEHQQKLQQHIRQDQLERAQVERIMRQLQEEHANIIKLQQETIVKMQQFDTERAGLIKVIEEHQATAATYALLQKTIVEKKALLEKHKQQYHQFVMHGNSIGQELKQTVQRRQMVEADHASCPLCEQHVSAARKRFLHQQLFKSEQWLSHRLTRLQTIIPTIKQNLIQEHAQLTDLEQRLSSYQITDAVVGEKRDACRRLDIQQEAVAKQQDLYHHRLEELLPQLSIIQEQLQKDSPERIKIREIQTTIEQIEYKLSHHPYHEAIHHQSLQRLKEITDLSSSDHERTRAAEQAGRKTQIQIWCNRVRQIRIEQKKYEPIRQDHKEISHQEQQLQQLHTVSIAQHKQLIAQKVTFSQEEGRLQELVRLHKQKEQSMKEIMRQVTEQEQIVFDYQQIAHATSKDGIQALLIEDAIPEIEQEANTILARLTDNQTHIHIESLKDLKRGGTKETLDIHISDAIGIRPYELFSGGEAFRIDFALRIAISKLLARRSGTALQTLIIDEGFGSQDEEGLHHIMQALYAIQEDFCKIIIVSHLPSMKEQFPVHFFIEKQAQGSRVLIYEHD